MEKLRQFVESAPFRGAVLGVILFNAVILGLQAMPVIDARFREGLHLLDAMIMWVFITEIALRIIAHGRRFFLGGWNIFDFVIIVGTALASTSGLAAVRVLRVLRVLRVVSVFPRLRVVVTALLDSIPGIASVGLILILIIYIGAIIAHQLFGETHAAWFGNLFTSMFTLFEIMTLEGWPDKAETIMETHPYAWVFFVGFILVTTFTLLNLFVAIVVSVLETETDFQRDQRAREGEELRKDMRDLRKQVEALTNALEAQNKKR